MTQYTMVVFNNLIMKIPNLVMEIPSIIMAISVKMIKMDSTTMIYRALVSTGAAEPVNLGQWVLATDNF